MCVWKINSIKEIYPFFSEGHLKKKRKDDYKYHGLETKRNLNLVENSHTILNVAEYRQTQIHAHMCAGTHMWCD